MTPLADFYRGKRVLVTGHTGFKGAWLSLWLQQLGAQVIGLGLDPPSSPSMFTSCQLDQRLMDQRVDIRSFHSVSESFKQHPPDMVFHLAAQPIVRRSFLEPLATYEINVMGTLNVLEAARHTPSVQAVIVVTSDKCYRNVEWEWPYRETDRLGGLDPYSASKACAELVVENYQSEKFQKHAVNARILPIASARAGNVLGGGDWAEDRLIPDLVRALAQNQQLVIRSPQSIRPWQHVLESLSGYLWLGVKLINDPSTHAGAWNFGPSDLEPWTTERIIRQLMVDWPQASQLDVEFINQSASAEAMTLRVDSSKARARLGWQGVWTVPRTLRAIADWYQQFSLDPDQDMTDFSCGQIDEYTIDAVTRGLPWASS
jgi:CDP-glucose 4,6-dehydratase